LSSKHINDAPSEHKVEEKDNRKLESLAKPAHPSMVSKEDRHTQRKTDKKRENAVMLAAGRLACQNTL
jgi:hypothetical protein